MAPSFYFFDLETTGFSPRDDRIMQFAGQRTDMDLNPIGEPDNILVKITPDILPQPDAVLVHRISPQKTLSEGISEAELAKYLTSQVFTKDTIAVGYNNIRFDNDFIRFTFWRNFTDAYEWAWKDGRSVWDLLDVVRMARALRPAGIKWPFASDGKPSNKLELLSAVNKLDHADAHDALSDVKASIALAKLVKTKNPELFGYLLEHRHKNKIKPLIESGKPFMYTSGRYPSELQHTSVAVLLGPSVQDGQVLVYDLRYDPDPYLKMSTSQLEAAWKWTKDPDAIRLPVKTLKYNRCPAILPGVVKDKETLERLDLSLEDIAINLAKVKRNGRDLLDKILEVVKRLDVERQQKQSDLIGNPLEVDSQLYEEFVPDTDKTMMSAVRAARPDDLDGFEFKDERLRLLLPLYKSRNYPKNLNQEEITAWDKFRRQKLVDSGAAAKFFGRLEELGKTPGLDAEKQYLLEELSLYAQNVIPEA